MPDIILCDIQGVKKVVDEEKLFWISEILEKLGVPDEVFDVDDIRDFRYAVGDMGIDVDYKTNGEVCVYKKKWHNGKTEKDSGWLPTTREDLVAEWKEPTYIRKIEGKKMHYELHLNQWSILNMR